MNKLLAISFFFSMVLPLHAQRVWTLESIIHTPLTSTARQICTSKGGNLLLQTQFTFYHCFFDTKLAIKKSKNNVNSR